MLSGGYAGWAAYSVGGGGVMRVALKSGLERDVFSGWRRMLCYTMRPGVCKKAKRAYNRRVRRMPIEVE